MVTAIGPYNQLMLAKHKRTLVAVVTVKRLHILTLELIDPEFIWTSL